MMQNGEKHPVLSGAVLKNAAYLTMFIDHFFAVVFLGYMRSQPADGGWGVDLESIYQAGRAVGRVSFILFAFLIVEGFVYTKSRLRFLLRLFFFALLSEIPFDLAFSGSVVDWKSQNIYWTLLFGTAALAAWEYLDAYQGFAVWGVRLLILAAGSAAAFYAATDYRFMGVWLLFAFYLTRERRLGLQIAAVGCVMLFGTFLVNRLRYEGFTSAYLFQFSLGEMYGLFAFVLIAAYSGARGRQLPKLFYYGFYPAHLLALYGVACAIS